MEEIKRTPKAISRRDDYHSIVSSAVDYGNAFLDTPGADTLLTIPPDQLMSKLLALSDKRHDFAAACTLVGTTAKVGKPFLTYASEINRRMPILSEEICDRLIGSHVDDCDAALKISPISKPEAPTLSGPIQAIPYSKAEGAKNHLAAIKARANLNSMTHIGLAGLIGRV